MDGFSLKMYTIDGRLVLSTKQNQSFSFSVRQNGLFFIEISEQGRIIFSSQIVVQN